MQNLMSTWEYDEFCRMRKYLLKLKRETGFSNRMLAEKSGVYISTVNKICNENIEPNPTKAIFKNMRKIIEAYDLNPAWFHDRTKPIFKSRSILTDEEKKRLRETRRKLKR